MIETGPNDFKIKQVQSVPPPLDVKINLGNLTKVYAANVKSSNDLVLQRYVIMVIYLMVTMVTMVTMVIIVLW